MKILRPTCTKYKKIRTSISIVSDLTCVKVVSEIINLKSVFTYLYHSRWEMHKERYHVVLVNQVNSLIKSSYQKKKKLLLCQKKEDNLFDNHLVISKCVRWTPVLERSPVKQTMEEHKFMIGLIL